MLTLAAVVGGLALFMVLLGAAHALDRYGLERYGYRPLALPNLAFMLIPHLALGAGLLALTDEGAALRSLPAALPWGLAGLIAIGGAGLIFMLVVVGRRTSGPMALIATLTMTLGASVLIFSMLFRDLAESQAPGD